MYIFLKLNKTLLVVALVFFFNNEKILLTTMLTIKMLFTIHSLEKKKKHYSFNTLFTIPLDLKST